MKEIYRNYINKEHSYDKMTMIGIYCFIVVIAGIFGFLYEFIFYYFNGGMKGFFWRGGNFLPWINIYAIGAMAVCFFAYRYRKNPWKVFLISLISCGVIELIGGVGLYVIGDGFRCWNYNTEILNFGNIGGFVCLRSVVFFGLSSLMLIYLIIPFCFFLANKVNKKVFLTISIILFSIILFDELYNLLFARILNLPRASDIYKQIGFHYVNFK
ncbi:MAG: putative ABC transporter permease [Bacilli bacterium]|nr:putative ABC transporter permease [Bacilli bacterium]